MRTFKESIKEGHIDIPLKKHGLSKGTTFKKEHLELFNIEEGDVIRYDNAEIIKKKEL